MEDGGGGVWKAYSLWSFFKKNSVPVFFKYLKYPQS